jgi:oxaloacetate decarboxylase alpha subunit
MAALITPYRAASLTKALKENISIPVDLHTHYTSGLASMCLLKAIENGCDIVDTAMSPLANGTSHTPTESLVAALKGTEYDTGLDLVKLTEIRSYFMTLREKYIKNGLLDPKVLACDANALIYQVPGGMLSNLLSQLKQAGKEEKFEEVLREVPKVRADAGNIPLVTPSSQIVGSQAVFNVLKGERYATVTKEFHDIIAGKYGKTPTPIDPEFSKKILGDEQPITCRPADLLEPELEKLRMECAEWIEQEEDVLTYAMFPKVAPKFFEKRRNKKYGVDPNADAQNRVHPV